MAIIYYSIPFLGGGLNYYSLTVTLLSPCTRILTNYYAHQRLGFYAVQLKGKNDEFL